MLPSVYTAKSYGLFVDGLDVLKEPATPARYAVDIDSISVTEAGSGGVSSMRFTIDDPSLVVTVADGAVISYWDLTRNLPIFVGFLESLTYTPAFGQQGRLIEVGAYGIEALLDTIIIPSLTAQDEDVAGGALGMWDGAMLAVLGGFTPLRTGADGLFGGQSASSLLGPIGASDGSRTTVLPFTGGGTTVVLSGMTVRQAFEAWHAAATTYAGGIGGSVDTTLSPSTFLSVDFWGGIRYFAFGNGVTTYLPSDYATLTITDTSAGAVAAENIGWEQDHSPGALTNAVYVSGGAAAATGWVTGDTRTGRHEAYATTAGATIDAKYAAAFNLLSTRQTPAGRGSLTLTSYTPTNVHPGSQLTITDARLGFASKACLVTEIRKTFNGDGTQNWTVSFIDGGDGPTAGWGSAMRMTRSLTRGTQN